MKFTILVDPYLVIIATYWFVFSMSGIREEDFLRNTTILHFLPPNYLPFGTISCLLTLQMLHTKLAQ